MITFDLRCSNGHIFEGWFQDNKNFEEQRDTGLLRCPICDDDCVEKLLSSCSIKVRDNKGGEDGSKKSILQELHEYIERNFEDVGMHFAREALKMHYGETEKRNIKGTTTKEEEQMLRQEKVEFHKISLPRLDS